MFLINKFRSYFIFLNFQAYFSLRNSIHASRNYSYCLKILVKDILMSEVNNSHLLQTSHVWRQNMSYLHPIRTFFFLTCTHLMVEVIKTKEDKINDIKAKSKDIVTQKLIIEVLNSFSLSSSARQPSLNMRFYRLCDLTGLHCVIAVFLKARWFD